MSDRRHGVGVVIERIDMGFGATQVLRDVSLEIAPGEFFAFLGPSGSGKTTLLRLVAGFGAPSAGRIVIDGTDVIGLAPWQRDVGMVFQNYALWPHMTVRRNVAFGLEERRLPRPEIERRVAAALDLVGLGALADRRPAQLSGGQQQRVALARTIVVQPKVLLLDEPLSNLDAQLRVQMRREILALQRQLGITTIYVTHDQEEANTTADRIAVLDGGALQQVGRPIDLYDWPANRFVASFLGSANLIDGTIAQEGQAAIFKTAAGLVLPMADPHADGAATLAVRPQAITLARAGPGWPGRIEGREFLGGQIRYAVAVGPHKILADTAHRRGSPAFDLNEAVVLAIVADQATVLRG